MLVKKIYDRWGEGHGASDSPSSPTERLRTYYYIIIHIWTDDVAHSAPIYNI